MQTVVLAQLSERRVAGIQQDQVPGSTKSYANFSAKDKVL